MKNAHSTTTLPASSNVANLDKSIESMRNQMEILEQQIDKVWIIASFYWQQFTYTYHSIQFYIYL